MAKALVPRKNAKKKQNGKENSEPELDEAHNSILETIFGDINDVVGRRSFIGKRSLCIKDNDDSIIDADDEKEKRERKEKEKAEKEKVKKDAEIKKTGINILNNLTQAELDEHYSKCIQLCNQNKVNVKNAFKLQLIDYMKIICMKQPSKTENLTLMGCTLGASAKIYAHRVDKVYTDMVKIVSGKELEVEKEDSDEVNEEDALNDLKEENDGTPKRRRRKDSSDSLEDDHDINLKKFNLDKMLMPENSLEKKKAENPPQEKPTLPVGIDYFLDCPVQEVDCRISFNPPIFSNYEIDQNSNTLFLNAPRYNGNFESLDPCIFIKDYKDLHKYFNLLGEKNNEELMNSSLAFDPSSRIELPDSIRLDADDPDIDCDDGAAPEGGWGMDYDDECLPEPEPELSVNSHKSGQVSVNQPKSFSAPNMAKLVSSKSNDYSFFDNSRLDFWAGPSHWSIKRVKDGDKEPKTSGDKIKKTAKKDFLIDFNNHSFKGLKKLYAEVDSSTLARKTMLTWSKSRCKFPQDIMFTQRTLFSLLKNTELLFLKKDSKTNLICSATLNENDEDTVLTPDDFSGDVSQVMEDGDDNLDDHCNDDFEPDVRESVSPLRTDDVPALNSNFELLPAPPKVNKIAIKYAKVQKRIDVKLLKNTIWDSMALEGQPKKETHEKPVKFSEIYSSLPDKLPKEEAAELSFPLAFMALLHMANEKNLALKGTNDYDDIYVSLD
ncbi:unnamed protein product [Nezara viridula]|uniref:Condensin complex subunit 2 n=1 Tax=Nezara viridula TaxID=85310 RepID=A0A9P0HB38_NEZVI|nr:unnamed protein product [Nezara viridula]